MRLTRVIVSVRCGCGKYRPVRLLLPLWFGLLVCVVYSSSIARLGWRSESGFISFQSSSVVPSSACRPQLRQSAIVAAAGCDVIKSDSIPSDIHFISFTHHFFFLLFFCNFCFRLIFCWYLNLIRWWSDEPISPGSDQDRIRIGSGSDQDRTRIGPGIGARAERQQAIGWKLNLNWMKRNGWMRWVWGRGIDLHSEHMLWNSIDDWGFNLIEMTAAVVVATGQATHQANQWNKSNESR